MDDSAALALLIDALRPWLGSLTFVGGWAHRLHRWHPLAQPAAYQPIRTRDADIAFDVHDRLDGNIRDALRAAGFEEEMSGDHRPPVTEYRLGSEDEGFFVEFLAPLQGSGVTRRGSPDVTVAKAGVTAQKLRHLDILLIAPWTLDVGSAFQIPTSAPAQLTVPNAVSFIVQKILIHHLRKPDKRVQDLLYIHDTLELFGASLEQLRGIWLESVRPKTSSKTVRRLETVASNLFREVTDDVRRAALIPQDRRLTPSHIRDLCAFALQQVLVG